MNSAVFVCGACRVSNNHFEYSLGRYFRLLCEGRYTAFERHLYQGCHLAICSKTIPDLVGVGCLTRSVETLWVGGCGESVGS